MIPKRQCTIRPNATNLLHNVEGKNLDCSSADDSHTPVPMINPEHEKHIRRAFLEVLVLCMCAVIPLLLSLMDNFRPQADAPGQWFQRSGAVMTVIAMFAQFKAEGIDAMIAGGAFSESWQANRKYKRRQLLAAGLSLALVVIGTVIRGYGDLLFPRHHTG